MVIPASSNYVEKAPTEDKEEYKSLWSKERAEATDYAVPDRHKPAQRKHRIEGIFLLDLGTTARRKRKPLQVAYG